MSAFDDHDYWNERGYDKVTTKKSDVTFRAGLARWMLGYTIMAGVVAILGAIGYGLYLLFNSHPLIVVGLGFFIFVGIAGGSMFYDIGHSLLSKDK